MLVTKPCLLPKGLHAFLLETSGNDVATSAQETIAPSLSLVWQSLKLQEVSGKAVRIITN